MDAVTVQALGSVRRIDRHAGFAVVGRDGREFEPATRWLLRLVANGCSPRTVRAYAMSLLRFFRFCWAIECPWNQADEARCPRLRVVGPGGRQVSSGRRTGRATGCR